MKKLLLSVAACAIAFTNASAQTYFTENFENGLGNWTLINSDGDAYDWETVDFGDGQGNVAISRSWTQADGPLTPDNWMVSSAIDLTNASGNVSLLWVVKGQDQAWADENYSVYVATASDITTLGTSTTTFTEVVGASNDMYLDRSLDVSGLIGQTIYVAFRHHGVTDQFILNVDDVSVTTINDVDVAITELTSPTVTTPGNIDITGTITSFGALTLDNVDLTWSDGTNSYTQNLTGLGLEYGDSYSFTHSDQLVGVDGNTYNITVIAEAAGDAYLPNDTMETSITIVSQVGERLSFVEDFSSSTCPPCEWLNVSGFDGSGLNAGLDAMNANSQSNAEVSVVKYPVDWPGNGDHAWNSEVEARRAYYGVTGAPTPFVDGVDYDFSTFNSGDINEHQDDITFFDISATHSISGTDITVNVTIDPFGNEDATLHIALVEKEYDATNAASFSNGETEFHHMMRKMLPDAGGTSVSLTGGTQYTTSESYSATVMDINDFDLSGSVGTFAFHQGAEIEVVVWLQAADKTVINSAVSVGDNEWITSVEDFSDNTRIGVYPNPVTNDQLNVVVSTDHSSDAFVTVTNMNGAVVLTENMGSLTPGKNKMTLDIAGLAKGLYNVNVISNGHVSSSKVTVK